MQLGFLVKKARLMLALACEALSCQVKLTLQTVYGMLNILLRKEKRKTEDKGDEERERQ